MKISYIQDVAKKQDWRMCGETGIVPKNLTDGNWLPDKPVDERQSGNGFESCLCTTFSGLNCLEMKMNFFLKNNQIPADALKFFNDNGYIVNGTFDFNEVFNANQNGSTPTGLGMVDFWESLRKVGVIPQAKWTLFDTLVATGDWNVIEKEIPQELKNLGLEFLKYVTISYDWVVEGQRNDSALHTALRMSPLQIAIAVCSPWGDNVPTCDITQAGHCVVLSKMEDRATIFDTYVPFIKTLGLNYYIVWAIRHSVEFTPYKVKFTPFTVPIVYGQRGVEVMNLQKILKLEGLFTLEPTGYYGDVTAKAVLAYQLRYNIQSNWLVLFNSGKKCGMNTVADLNKRYA